MENLIWVVKEIFWYPLHFIIRVGRQRGEMVREVTSVRSSEEKDNKRFCLATSHHVATTVLRAVFLDKTISNP